MPQYKMIQIPPNIKISSKKLFGSAPKSNEVASRYLEHIVNQEANNGWEFQRIDTIGVAVSPGCIMSLFGAQETMTYYYVITFSKPSYSESSSSEVNLSSSPTFDKIDLSEWPK